MAGQRAAESLLVVLLCDMLNTGSGHLVLAKEPFLLTRAFVKARSPSRVTGMVLSKI